MNVLINIIWGFLWLIIGVCLFGIMWDCAFLDFKSKLVPRLVDIGLKIIFVIFALGFIAVMIGGFLNKGICK